PRRTRGSRPTARCGTRDRCQSLPGRSRAVDGRDRKRHDGHRSACAVPRACSRYASGRLEGPTRDSCRGGFARGSLSADAELRSRGGSTMTKTEHLWAVGDDDMERAHQVRDEIVRVGGGKNRLLPEDPAVGVGHPEGSFALDRERFPAASNLLGCSAVGFLAGLVIGLPLVGAAVGAVMGGAGTAMGFASAGIGGDFVREVQGLMNPGTSALFVLDCGGDMDVILHTFGGRGGRVLKTKVDVERARLIQSTLAAAPSASPPP